MEFGKEQCRALRGSFDLRNIVSIVLSSYLRRAIQTTVLSFGPSLSRSDVRFLILP